MASRKRLSPEESRLAALEAARTLLIETGPQSITLKAVGARIGRTHANLLHHFGSAEGLQKALIAHMASTIVTTIKEAVIRSREAEDPAEVVVEPQFAAGVAGRLDRLVPPLQHPLRLGEGALLLHVRGSGQQEDLGGALLGDDLAGGDLR